MLSQCDIIVSHIGIKEEGSFRRLNDRLIEILENNMILEFRLCIMQLFLLLLEEGYLFMVTLLYGFDNCEILC